MDNALSVAVREARADDVDFLRRMLYFAAGYRSGPDQPSLEEVLSRPIVARYLRSWKGPQDVGVIAEHGGTPIGAAWYTQFQPADCLGPLDDTSVSVIAIAVEEGWRGRGLGHRLLHELVERARRSGLDRLDLTASRENAASMALYRSTGFQELSDGERMLRMTLRLQANPRERAASPVNAARHRQQNPGQ